RLRRRGALGRAGPSARLRADLPARPRPGDPGRGILAARPGHRAAGACGAGPAARRAYRHYRGAPAGYGRVRRRYPGARGRAGARVRTTRAARGRPDITLCRIAARRHGGDYAMRPLPTWRYTLKMARYAPWLYLLHGAGWSLMNLLSLVPGLIARAYFDTLTSQARMPSGIPGLLGLLSLVAVGRAALWLGAGFVEINFRFTMSGLVRRNLLRLVLARPGASALPFSIGETISRFRDDAYEAEDNMDW